MDIKQLKYFIACVEAGSISGAARILYSTQSSVSKAVKSLEDSLGIQLFERLPRGIRLTAQGQKVYRSACKIVNEVGLLEQSAGSKMAKWLRIVTNPSSWFADRFVKFYNEVYEKNYHFQVTTAGVRTVMERVQDYLDDVGFVYILDHKKEDFLSELSANGLSFTPLHTTNLLFYPGKNHPLYNSGSDKILLSEVEGTRFIQNNLDEYFDIETLQDGGNPSGLDISVVTNSDYIMERMLRKTSAANISGSYLSENKADTLPGISLESTENKVIFGYILHKKEEPEKCIQEFIDFLKDSR